MAAVDLAPALFRGGRVLCISPHADDETYGCAGTLARAASLGAEIGVMIVSVGDLEHYSNEHPNVSGSRRQDEFLRAMQVLGVQHTDVLFTDARSHLRIDAVPRRDLIARIERQSPLALDRFRPDVLLFPAVSYNQDHEAVFKAVIAACRPHLPADKPFIRAVLAFDQPQLAWNHTPFHPNVYVDISDFLEQKLTAYRCHASQVRPEPHHASVENVERLARLRGSEVSVAAAEAFYCYRLLI
jgi:LmbE family N-acetylglucosaminyl deacetylase